MPKISNLPSIISADLNDLLAIVSKDNQNVVQTMKIKIAELATKLNNNIEYGSLNTTDKKIIGAINEVKSSAKENLSDLTDTTITTPSNADLLAYDSSTSKWVNTDLKGQASGSIATFSNGGNGIPCKSLVVSADLATPTNTFDVVDCGKNILKPTTAYTDTSNYVTFTVMGDGTIKANGTATGGNAVCYVNGTIIQDGDLYETLKPFDNVDCIGSGCPSVNGCRISFARMNGSSFYDDTGNGVSFTISNLTPTTNAYVRLQVDVGTTVNNVIFRPMIRRATDSATYEPYTSNTYNITLPSSMTEFEVDIASGNGTDLSTNTPFTITPVKTPTLSGNNYIYASAGDVNITYFTDKADNIAELIKAFL